MATARQAASPLSSFNRMSLCGAAQLVGPDIPYLSLDHVDPPWAQLPHAVVNIHHTLSLCHVQHDVDDDEAACSSRSSTAGKHKEGTSGGQQKVLFYILRSRTLSFISIIKISITYIFNVFHIHSFVISSDRPWLSLAKNPNKNKNN